MRPTALIRTLARLAGRDPVRVAKGLGVRVGDDCRFLGTSRATFGSEPYLISIGNHVTITAGVRFVTHDGGVWVFRKKHPQLDVVAPITVGDNVFIGLNAIVLPGVSIGDNVVIAAGCVVARDIPSDSIAAGVPAKVISSIERYLEASLRRGVPSKGMSPTEKEKFLKRRYISGPVASPAP